MQECHTETVPRPPLPERLGEAEPRRKLFRNSLEIINKKNNSAYTPVWAARNESVYSQLLGYGFFISHSPRHDNVSITTAVAFLGVRIIQAFHSLTKFWQFNRVIGLTEA